MLYSRRLWLAEAGAFVIGVELLAAGVLAENTGLARGGGVALVAAAGLAAGGAAWTWRRRPGAGRL